MRQEERGIAYLSDIRAGNSACSGLLLLVTKLSVTLCLQQEDSPVIKIHSPIMISGGRRQSCNILRVISVAHQRPGDIDKQLIHTELQSERVSLLVIFTHLTSSSHLSLW